MSFPPSPTKSSSAYASPEIRQNSNPLPSLPSSPVESRSSFIKLPDPAKGLRSLSSGLVAVVQEQAATPSTLHLMPLRTTTSSTINTDIDMTQLTKAVTNTGSTGLTSSSATVIGDGNNSINNNTTITTSNIPTPTAALSRADSIEPSLASTTDTESIRTAHVRNKKSLTLDPALTLTATNSTIQESTITPTNNKNVQSGNTTSNNNNNSNSNSIGTTGSSATMVSNNNTNSAETPSKQAIASNATTSTTNTTSTTTTKKLVSAGNPSFLNLRGIASQQLSSNGNTNTVSSTQSKNSTRAEYFAAKVHNAMKDEEKRNKPDDETFLYETDTNVDQTEQQQSQQQQTQQQQQQQQQPQVRDRDGSISVYTLPLQQSPVIHSRNPTFSRADSKEMTTQLLSDDNSSQSETVINCNNSSRFGSTNSTSNDSSNTLHKVGGPRKSNATEYVPASDDAMFDTRSRASTNNYYRKGSKLDALTAFDVSTRGNTVVVQPQNHQQQQQHQQDEDLVSLTTSRSELQSIDQQQTQTQQQAQPPQQQQQQPQPTNHLRQITSRIFDSKGVHPRRYSGMDIRDFAVDAFEDPCDSDDEHFTSYIANHETHNNINNYGAIEDYDSDFEDELSVNEAFARNNNGGQFNSINGLGYYTTNSLNGTVHQHATNAAASASNNPYQQPLLQGSPVSASNKFFYNSVGGFSGSNSGSGTTSNNRATHTLKRKRRDSIYFSPHDFTSARTARIRQIKSFCYALLAVVVFVTFGFICGFLLATSKDLQHTKIVGIENVLISEQELVFGMSLESFNPGLIGIPISEVELDFFAKTQYLNGRSVVGAGNEVIPYSYDTVMLGSVTHLDIPFYIEGGFITRQGDRTSTEIKIVNPCTFDSDDKKEKKPATNPSLPSDGDEKDNDNKKKHNDTDNDDDDGAGLDSALQIREAKNGGGAPIIDPNPKWLNISKNPFELIVRGVLTYQLPITSSNRTVGVNFVHYIDPGSNDLW
ncbi:unnamed protein product [Ambrosiozyma monospora]|uniref:Unnamed protein product n=1 Tax=Ambrosiozyma monospora TaxID=43982 RepID=A0ACB5T0D2_AMBMO|nr:unnamed protein product [Ambrosiozyma monospora]